MNFGNHLDKPTAETLKGRKSRARRKQVDRLGQTRLNWYMDNEPEWVLALYRNHKMLDLEHALARDI
jgi:hypothetical protein